MNENSTLIEYVYNGNFHCWCSKFFLCLFLFKRKKLGFLNQLQKLFSLESFIVKVLILYWGRVYLKYCLSYIKIILKFKLVFPYCEIQEIKLKNFIYINIFVGVPLTISNILRF